MTLQIKHYQHNNNKVGKRELYKAKYKSAHFLTVYNLPRNTAGENCRTWGV